MSKTEHLILIDSGLSDFSSVIENLPEGSTWHKISGMGDGILQIEEIAKDYNDLSSIQIVSHGNSGQLTLGSTVLSSSNLANYETNLAEIGKSLSPSGDILIYGCNVASNDLGEKFIESIAEYTLADVAASADLTGSKDLGGDSILEFHSGDVSTKVINVENLTETLWTDSQIEAALTNTNLENLMKTYNDGASEEYTYLEMRNLLEAAAVGGITTSEFADLKTIYTNIESKFATDPNSTDSYVKYITYSTIYPSAANKTWWGGAQKLSDTEVLGNMHANMSEDKATKLIQTWFYGKNLPMPVAGGDTANPDAEAKVGIYKASTGTMFKADIDIVKDAAHESSVMAGVLVTSDDMNQGQAGTCWILACLGAVAHAGTGDIATAGKAIETLVIDPITDDQIWGMKFYGDNAKPVYVTVNSEIPISTSTYWKSQDKILFSSNSEKYTLTKTDKDPDGVSNGDNLSSAGNLTLDGAFSSGGVATMSNGYGKMLITSSGDDSGVTFTVTGVDYWNNAKTETITGANAGEAKGNTWWKTVSQISASGATDGTVIAGKQKYLADKTYTTSKDLNGELWPALFEKGYTQANPLLASRHGGEVSYAAMESGGAIGFTHLLGTGYQLYSANPNMYWYSNVDKGTKQMFVDFLAKGAVGYVGGGTKAWDGTQRTIIKGHAHALLEYDASTDKFLVRNPWGGDDRTQYNDKKWDLDVEFWMTFDELTVGNNNTVGFSQPISIKPQITYTYTMSSDASTTGSAVFEGKPVTFTINRDNVGDETTVYLSTAAGSANSTDYEAHTKVSLKFGKQETQKTFVVNTLNDSLTEGSDTFKLDLFLETTQATATLSSTAYVKDPPLRDYTYSISSNAASADDALTEGGNVTFTITRAPTNSSDGVSDSDSVIYLATAKGSAGSDDFTAINKQQVQFKAFQSSKKVTVKTTKDTEDEGEEYFLLNLYKDLSKLESAVTAHKQAAGYIADEWAPTYDYSIISDAGTQASAKSEGQAVTFTVTRSGSGTQSKVFVATENKSAMSGMDYDGFSDSISGSKAKELTFQANQKTITVEVQTKLDDILETTEFFQLGLYKDLKTKTIEATGTAFITDGDFKTDRFSITNDSIAGGDPDGISITQNLNDDDFIATASQGASSFSLGGTKNLGGKVATIFSAGNDSTAKFTITGTKAAIDLNLDGDTIDTGEGAGVQTEVIWGGGAGQTVIGQKIFETVTGVTVDKAVAGAVKVGVSGGDLAINGALHNGGTATLNGKFVSITSAGNDTGVKFTVTGTDTADNALEEVIFGSSAQTATGTKLFKTVTKISADAATSGNLTAGVIGDGTDENKDITFTITRTNVNNAADTIYLSTSPGTAKDTDFDGFTAKALTFAEYETKKTVTVKAKSDSLDDDNEYFWLNMYLNKTALENNVSSVNDKAYIDHVAVPTQHTYAITNNSPSSSGTVSEGGDITFTITRTLASGTDAASTIYVKTGTGTANSEDFTAIDTTVVNFGKKEKLKTITVKTKSDNINESDEDFYLLAFKTFDDAENDAANETWQYNKAFIKNVTVDNYKYTVSSDSGLTAPVEEGDNVTFTITRSGVGTASTVYVNTSQGTADSEDFTPGEKIAVNFAGQQTTKTVKISTLSDTLKEGTEYFHLGVFKTIDDLESGIFTADTGWGTGYVTDKAGTAADDYTYAFKKNNGSAGNDYDTENSGTAVTEGDEATFTIARTLGAGKSASAATVYVSTVTGTAGVEDYQSLDKLAIDFKSDELTKEVTVKTDPDSITDDGEYFFVNVYKSADDADEGIHAAWTKAFIANDAGTVATAANYNYAINSSNNIDDGSGETAVTEGNDITFTITRTKTSGADAATTVYVSTSEGSAYSDDYQGLVLQEVLFKKDEAVKTVTVNTIADTKTEDTGSNAEYFWLDLYKSKADADDYNYHAWAKGHITDDNSLKTAIDTYKYSVTGANNETAKAIKEGGEVTFTITRSREDSATIGNSDVASTVYVSTSEGTAYDDDYIALNLQAVEFKKTETTKVVKVKTKSDTVTEDNEYFWFDVFETKADAEEYNYAAWDKGYISNDAGSVTAGATYSYTVTGANNSTGKAVTEGDAATFTITRSNSGGAADTASTIYLSTTAGTASDEDFEVITNKEIKFAPNENTKTITVGTKKDAETDDGEYFWFDIYKTLSDAENSEYYQWDKGYIKDDANSTAALTNYSYAVTTAHDSSNKVLEGSSATFTITRTKTSGSDVAATVFVRTSEGTAGTDDFESITKQAIEFKANELTKTVTIQTKEDAETDDGEYFYLELYKTEADIETCNYNDYSYAYIGDNANAAAAVNNYTYTITGDNNTESTAASEGSNVTFTVTRTKDSGSNVAATVYLTTTHSTTDSDDIVSWDKKALEFKADELSKTVVIQTNTDNTTEGKEYFWLDLFKTKADADNYNYAAWDMGYIDDNTAAASGLSNYSYTVTSSASSSLGAVTEGSTIEFTITRTKNSDYSGSDLATTVYVGTRESSAMEGVDYKGISEPLEVFFNSNETKKTVYVETYADDETEAGTESFYLGVIKTKADVTEYLQTGDSSLVDAYSTGYIKDSAAASGTYTYTVTTNSDTTSNAKTEGTDITVTIARAIDSGSAGDSTIYVNTTEGSAGATDYVAQKATPVSFTSSDGNGATKTFTIKTSIDSDSDDDEYFYVDLFKTKADAEDGWNYFDWATAYINNGQALASAGITYTIDAQSGQTDEGGTVTFTIKDDSTLASKIYVKTVNGTALSGEDYKGITAGSTESLVEFGTSDTSKTVTVNVYSDAVSDDNETFYLELYKSEQDMATGTVHKESKATINNVAPVVDNYTYTITSSHLTENAALEEGNDLTFTITRSGSSGTTKVYLNTYPGDADATDYTKKTAIPITFSEGDTQKPFVVPITDDGTTEGAEYLFAILYKSLAEAEARSLSTYDSVGYGYIKDAGSSTSSSYTYTIANSNTLNGSAKYVVEGGTATFTVTRSSSGSESTVYVSTYGKPSGGSDWWAEEGKDYTSVDHKALTFAANETTKTVSVDILADSGSHTDTSNEAFYLVMNQNSTTSALVDQVWDLVYITAPSGMLASLGSVNAGSVSGADTVTVTSASKTSFPGHKAGQVFNDYAFAATTSDGKVVNWGNSAKGGDSSAVSGHLTGVSNLYTNASAFAAVKSDGSVVTWGDANAGGTSWDADGLSISASVSAGGNLVLGGASTSSSSATFTKANKVTITSVGNDSGRTFTVTGTSDGTTSQTETITGANAGTAEGSKLFKTVSQISVDSGGATAGKVSAGNLYSLTYAKAADLNGGTDVSKIASTSTAFAALRSDGSVITWGNKGNGGDSRSVSSDLDGTVKVRDIYSNLTSFAALREDGTVITWGYSGFGGNSSSVSTKITTKTDAAFQKVTDISATGSAFAAIRSDGSVVTWGNSLDGGDSSSVASAIDGDSNPTDVVQVYSTTSAFAALQQNGAVITWGDVNNGGSVASVAASVNGSTDVTKIFSTNSAFSALRSDGSIITWGNATYGGNSSSVSADLDGDSNGDGNASDTTQDITKVFSTTGAFAAVRADNKVVTWGYGAYGGDSTSVASIINGTLDADCISVSATVSANANFTIGGDQTSGGAASFANAERITITSSGDDSARTFTITGTNSSGATETEQITGANAGAATGLKYFKTVTQISVDSGGNTAGAVTAGVINKEVKTVVSTDKAFAALLKDGSVITWGDSSGGGDSSGVSSKLIMGATNGSVVTQLYGSSGAFSAIKADGSVVTWGNSDLGGDSTGVDFSSSSVSGMSGASSGVECTVKHFSSGSKAIKSQAITLMTNESTPKQVSGTFVTDTSGSLDLSDANDGNYTASFMVTNSTHIEKSIDIYDVLDILDYTTGAKTPSSDQIVAANVRADSSGTMGALDIYDMLDALDMSTGAKTPGKTVLRDSAATAASYNSDTSAITNAENVFAIQAGGTLNLKSYFLGDVDGDYGGLI